MKLADARLESICTRIGSGGTPSRRRPEFFTTEPSGHLWVKSKELLDRGIETTEERISEEGLRHSAAKYYPENTVLLAMYGANVGQLGWLKTPATLNQAICGLVVDETKADWRFVFYSLLLHRGDLTIQAQGAAQQNLNQDLIKEFKIPLFPLPVQRQISGTLRAYDDLIAINERRIQVLDGLARILYREWFVNFRFPGVDTIARVPSTLGPLPKGWSVKTLGDICDLAMGQSPRSEFYNQTGDGLPFHQGVRDFGERFPADRLFCTAEGRNAQEGDILFSVRAPVGRLNIANKRIVIGRGLAAIRHKQGHQAFLWEQLRDRFQEEDMIGNGAIFAAVTTADMQGIELISPPEPIVRTATRHLARIHEMLAVLSKQSANLSRTRDVLLPRLLSGRPRRGNDAVA